MVKVVGRFAALATLVAAVLVAPLGGGAAHAAAKQCPRDVLRSAGLTVGRQPRFAELPGMFTNYVVKKPRVQNYCLVDLWTVPETGWYTERYLVVVKVGSKKIVRAYKVGSLAAASPHDWEPADYKGIAISSTDMESAAFGMICWGYLEIQGQAIFRLIKRVAGYMPTVYCS